MNLIAFENDLFSQTLNLLECRDRCVCFNLRKAARAVTQIYDEALRPVGLRATQFTLLAAVGIAGSETVSRLAERVVMDRTTLTRNLRLLEKMELVRIDEGEDRRERRVCLTQSGANVLEKAYPVWEETQRRVASELGMERLENLLRDLQAVVEVIQQE